MRLGTMRFADGRPTPETLSNAYDQLDLLHGVNAFMNGYQVASTYAMRQGFLSAGPPAAETNEDGSTTVHFAPAKPDGVPEGNWIQTDTERGFFAILRLYSPLEGFFDKSWQVGEVERAQA